MGFMNEGAEDIGWNDCIIYLQSHLAKFHDSLQGGQYDYFPYDEIQEKLEKLKRNYELGV